MTVKKKPAPPDDDAPSHHDAKQRTCLSCRAAFSSIWAGEGICTPCKRSSSWRTGSAHKRAGLG